MLTWFVAPSKAASSATRPALWQTLLDGRGAARLLDGALGGGHAGGADGPGTGPPAPAPTLNLWHRKEGVACPACAAGHSAVASGRAGLPMPPASGCFLPARARGRTCYGSPRT